MLFREKQLILYAQHSSIAFYTQFDFEQVEPVVGHSMVAMSGTDATID